MGNRVAIGAFLNDFNGFNSGAVRIYEWDGISWNKLGSDIYGQSSEERFGKSLSLNHNGDRIVVGAFVNDYIGYNSGAVRVYEWDGFLWNQIGQDIYGEAEGDLFGDDVSINSNGNKIIVGAPRNDNNGIWSGHVKSYSFNGNTWSQNGQSVEGQSNNDWFGISFNKFYGNIFGKL